MNDFVYHNPDRVYFGSHQMQYLPKELQHFGQNVLLVYGGGSIKKNGIYDEVLECLTKNKLRIFELSGVEPNPRHTTVNRGAAICKQENIQVILAVGGGSTIDCAKGIAAAAVTPEGDVWPLVKQRIWIEAALPVIAVLTNAATGSEMDAWAVISNMETNEKIGLGGNALIPQAAFENPVYSFTLPAYQTACGSFDIFNHVLDNYYFAQAASFDMIMEFQEAVMRAVVKWAPIAMKEPEHYEARANLMWASSMALNGVLDAGSQHDCACHAMEHELSAYYDITHGHGLAILTPRWLMYILSDETAPAIYRLGKNVFGVDAARNSLDGARLTIEAVSEFCFETLGLRSTLSDLGITDEHFEAMAEHACVGGSIAGMKSLTPKDVEKIYRMCL